MKCTNCGFEQQEGKFCGKCGTPMAAAQSQPEEQGGEWQAKQEQNGIQTQQHPVKQAQHAPQADSQPKQNNPQQQEEAASTIATEGNSAAMDKVKYTSKAFWSYFLQHLKQPSAIFQKGAGEFTNGLISIVIAIVLFSLSGYWLARNVASAYTYGGMWGVPDIDVPFFSIAGNIFLYSVILIAIVLVILFLASKIMGISISFKSLVSIFGAHTVLIDVVALAAFLLLLLKANTVGTIVFLIALGLLITSMPLYLISNLLTRYAKTFDAYYGYLIYLILAAVAFSIYITILADSSIGNLLDSLDDIF